MVDVRALTGTCFLGWNLVEELGRGADGVVYLVTDGSSNRALKIFFPESLHNNGLEEQLERLELQLMLAGKKQHPNLVEVFDGGFCEEYKTIYLFMEYVEGLTLDKLIGKLPASSIAPLITQLADAASFLEEKSLVHRDIKPANIIVNNDFTILSLLDLGIVHEAVEGGQCDERLSGEEFVASLRYSPPEFVWRQELGADNDAWRAITFYQIGATLYDMIEGRCIFDGHDKPRACLYDSVRWRTPLYNNNEVDAWLIQLAQSCLVKAWRERISLIDWASFKGPSATADFSQIRRSIRLRQIHADEYKVFEKEVRPVEPDFSFKKALWELQGRVFMEIRQFLISEAIFPRFSGTHKEISESNYSLQFLFEQDESLKFNESLDFKVDLRLLDENQLRLEISVLGSSGNNEIFKGLWVEAFSVEKVVETCMLALYKVADKVVL